MVEGGAATTYEVKNTDGQVVETRNAPTQGYNIDIIGTIYKPTGNLIQQQGPDNTTIEVPEMEALEGFHANMRGPFDLHQRSSTFHMYRQKTTLRILIS